MSNISTIPLNKLHELLKKYFETVRTDPYADTSDPGSPICIGVQCNNCILQKRSKVCTLGLSFITEDVVTAIKLSIQGVDMGPSYWKDVKVDTPVLVSSHPEGPFSYSHFHSYDEHEEVVRTWDNGRTSKTALKEHHVTEWNYAKLPKEGE